MDVGDRLSNLDDGLITKQIHGCIMICRLLYVIVGVLLFTVDVLGQNTWVKTYGGTGDEIGNSITTTSDGGYVLTGITTSTNYDFTRIYKGGKDIFVWKLNIKGDTVWKKVFGGSSDEYGYSITSTTDGGYVLTGGTISNDGDFSGRESGGYDIFVFKLNSNGDIVWKKTFGGGRNDKGMSITTTSDGGYVLTGITNSDDGYFIGVNTENGYDYIYDIFVMKLSSNGDIVWKKGFGGSGRNDEGMSITTTSDGGYVLTGYTGTNNGDFSGMNKGGTDIFVIKVNLSGDIVWKKTYGGGDNEYGNSITTTSDGGFVLTGYTGSNDGDFTGMTNDKSNNYVIKLNSIGDIVWKKTFGHKTLIENSFAGQVDVKSITTTSDGGYVLTGKIKVNYDTDNNIIVIKLDKNGDIVWKKLFGGYSDEYGNSITTTSDGGFVLTGVTSSNGGDFNNMRKGYGDIFVIKLDKNGNLGVFMWFNKTIQKK